MKKYKFFDLNYFDLDYYGGLSANYYYKDNLPPEFTYDQLKAFNDKDHNLSIPEYKMKKIKNARTDTIIHIRHISRNSDLIILCLGEFDDSEIGKVRKKLEKNVNRRKEINAELNKIAKYLIDEKKTLEKEAKKLNDYIDDFEDGK